MSSSSSRTQVIGWTITGTVAVVAAGLVYASLAWAGFCAGDCSGGPGPDSLYGGNANQTIEGLGSADDLYGGGGQDNVQGDGGATDYIEVESGNGENGRGGEGVSDIVKVWGDSGTDNAYGGAQENDYCYVDVPPGGDDNWDNTCEQVRKQ